MISFGKLGQNSHFWAKIANFGPKKGQKVNFQIFCDKNFFAIFFKTKNLGSMAKTSKNL